MTPAWFVFVCLNLFWWLGSPSASAHAELVSTTPSPGAELATSPTSIRVVFNEGVRPIAGGSRLVRDDGVQISLPAPSDIERGFEVSIPKLDPGAYVFGWRVVSDDGHPIRGAFTFRVGNVGDQSLAASLAQSLLAGPTRDSVTGAAYTAARVARLLSTFVLIGLTVMFVALRGKLFSERKISRLLVPTVLAGIVAEVGVLLLYGPFVSGRTLSSISDGVLLDATLRDPLGRVAALRVAALVALMIVWRKRPSGRKTVHGLFAISIAVIVAATQLIPGHATVGMWSVASAVAMFLHVLAAGVWLGGLAVLGVAILGSSRLDRVSASRSFSSLATVALIVVLVTGAFSTARQVGSVRALTTTTFGRILLVKLALVAITILLGLRNRRRLPTMATPFGESTSAFRSGVVREASFSITIAIAAVLLGTAQPARDAVRVPVSATIEAQNLLIDLTVEPAKRNGTYEIHLYALDSNGLPATAESMRMFASLPDKQIERLPIDLQRAGSNHFQALNAQLAVPGDWRFEVHVSIDEFTETSGSKRLSVR